MKLSQAIANKDWSQFQLSNYSSFENYYDRLADVLYPDSNSIHYDHYEAVEKTGRTQRYAVREWLCTDQHVGLYLYVVDGEPVCLMHQTGRKSYPEWTFFSAESYAVVKQMFDDCRPAEHQIRIPLVDPDIMHLQLDQKRIAQQIDYADMGLSPIMMSANLIENLNNAEISKASAFVDYVEDAVAGHDEFMVAIQSQGADAVARATERSAQIHADALAVIRKLADGK